MRGQIHLKYIPLEFPRKQMGKPKKQFLILLLEGIGTVFVSALPVHIAQICHRAACSFPVIDVFPEWRGGGQSLQKELVRADGMAEVLPDPVFLLQDIPGQAVRDAEPVGPFTDFDSASL